MWERQSEKGYTTNSEHSNKGNVMFTWSAKKSRKNVPTSASLLKSNFLTKQEMKRNEN